MSQPNFYAIIPATVRYDGRLKPNAKLLYGEITALCNQEGFCWADNRYFSDLYSVDPKTISRWISQLEEYGYINSVLYKNGGNKRKITIDKIVTTYTQKSHEVVTKKSRGSDKKVTSIKENNTINNTINRESTALGFLEKNHQSEYETLMMQNRSKIPDWDDFVISFEATVDQEGLEFKLNVLRGRFTKYAQNWIRNKGKFDKPENSGTGAESNKNHPSRQRIS